MAPNYNSEALTSLGPVQNIKDSNLFGLRSENNSSVDINEENTATDEASEPNTSTLVQSKLVVLATRSDNKLVRVPVSSLHVKNNNDFVKEDLMLKAKEKNMPSIKLEKCLKGLKRQSKIDPNFLDKDGLNLLMVLIVAKNVEGIRILFNLGLYSQFRDHRIAKVTQDIRPDITGKDALELAQTIVKSKKVVMEIKLLDELVANMPPLHRAAREGDLENLVRTLEHSSEFEVKKRDAEGNTALHYACINGDVDVVKELLRRKASINAVNHKEQNLLHVATQHENIAVVKYLLNQRKINLDDVDFDGKSPVLYTAVNGSVKTLRILLSAGAKLDRDILGTAAGNGNLAYLQHASEKLKLCLMHRDKNNKSVLHHACAHGRLNIIDHLLGTLSTNLQTQLFMLKDRAGCNILHALCISEVDTCVALGRILEQAKSLSVLGEMLNEKNLYTGLGSCVLVTGKDKGKPAYHYVEVKRFLASLFENKVRSGMVDVAKFGQVAKSGWGEHPNPEVIKEVEATFISRLDSQNNPQLDSTPLHLALFKEKVELVKLLLAAQADVNIQDSFGLAPMHLAAMRGNLELVKMLDKAGADLSVVDHRGMTATAVAKENEHLSIVHYLQAKEHMDPGQIFYKTLEQKIPLFKKEEIEKYRQKGVDVKRHLINMLRDIQIEVNIALMAIGSSPIMEESCG